MAGCSLSVGILQTDSVLEDYQPRFGDYPDMFRTLLEDAAAALDTSLTLRTFDAQAGELPDGPEHCDGYVITGSRHSVYDDAEWIRALAGFLGEVLGARGRIVGICFGHQLLAHFFGGRTEPAAVGWGVGVHESRLERSLPWMAGAADSVRLLSSHKDQVTALPEGARLFATSDFCPLAGFVIDDRAMTLQGHPEFSKPYAEALMRRREALLGPDVFEAGLRSLAQPTDEAVVGEWMLRFLGGFAQSVDGAAQHRAGHARRATDQDA